MICMARAILNQYLVLLRRYYVDTCFSFLSTYLFFYFLFLTIRGVTVGTPLFDKAIENIVIGFFIFFLGSNVFSGLAWGLASEAQQGTLEQLSMSPFGLTKILLTKVFISILFQFFFSVAFLYLMMTTSGIILDIRWLELMPILFFTLAGVLGLGLFMGGLVLVFKKIRSIFQFFHFVFIGVVMVPLSTSVMLKFFPLSWGAYLMRKIILENKSILHLEVPDMIFLVANSICYLCVGILVFRLCERIARDRGLLSHY